MEAASEARPSAPARPRSLAPRAARRRPLKALRAADCTELEHLPNIGPALAADLRRLGIHHPAALARADGLTLYRQLCEATGKRQDPCVLDTFLAVTDFMRGAPPAPWWHYTAGRKQRYGEV